MIWILLYLVITIITISVCYFNAKKYHHTVKEFLIDCLLVIILPPFAVLFSVNELIDFIKIKYPKFKINTDFITKFLNKKL
jgi:hypothetical protein